jgi:hypothetical protein
MNTKTKAPEVVLELQEQQTHQAPAVIQQPRMSPNAGDILAAAYERGADPQVLAQLLQLKAEFERQEARKAFVAAMARFKKNPPEIIKDKAVGYTDTKGNFVGYKHATLASVCDAAIKGLADVGISHGWSCVRRDGEIEVFCTLTHEAGHSETVSIPAPADTSGKKNAIQSIGSTITYLERYTLLMITGLATADQDDDGAQHKDPIDAWVAEYREAIQSAKDLNALIAAWKTAASACRRKKNEPAYVELQNEVVARRDELGVTAEQWATVVGK